MKNISLINILVNKSHDTIFLKSIEASNQFKDANYIFRLDGVLEEIGKLIIV